MVNFNACSIFAAIFLTELSRHTDALTQWLKAESIAPKDFDTVFNTASAYRQMGKNDAAEKYYLKSTKLQPTVRTERDSYSNKN